MSNLNHSVKRNGIASISSIESDNPLRLINQSNEEVCISERELEVWQLIADGFTGKEIAGLLYISVYTVASHKMNIMAKLEVKNIAALISAGFRLGLIK